MKARGKSRLVGTSPLVDKKYKRLSPERAEYYFGLSGLGASIFCNQGRRASRLPLAIIFRAVGALLTATHSIPVLEVTIEEIENRFVRADLVCLLRKSVSFVVKQNILDHTVALLDVVDYFV